MDLVDIDQVLDNFELYEEAKNEQSRRAEEKLSIKPELNSSNTNNGHVQQPVENSTDQVCFKAVTHVLNSLDDYCNKVEFKTPTAAISEMCKESQEQFQTGYIFKPQHLDSATKLELAEYENEMQSSEDIHKFTDEKRKKLKPNNDLTEKDVTDSNNSTTSESLTTSSNSTFSSGPTFEVESSVDDPSLATENKEASGYATSVKFCKENEIAEIESKLETQNSHNNGEEDFKAVQSKKDMSVQEKDVAEDNKSKNIEDLAQGLSSISIASDHIQSQSMLPLETSLSSSSLGKVLDNLTDSEDTSAFSQIRDLSDKIITSGSKFTPIVSEAPNTSIKAMNESVEQRKFTIQQTKLRHLPNEENFQQVLEHCQIDKESAVQFQQPITFCSTMDDISDTELDSMLQEMDIDEENADEQSKCKSNLITMGGSEASENSESKINNLKETYVSASMKRKEDVTTSSSSDHPNCDSFSQASTVEFSEVRQQLENEYAAEPETNLAFQSGISSYSNSESSSLEGDIIRTKTYEVDDDIDTTKPQRPTSLDLPALQLQGVDVYANAGQTPPGNEQQQQISLSQQELNQSENKTPEEQKQEQEEDQSNHITNDVAEATGYSEDPNADLGKVPPIWVPDNMATGCMNCSAKFTMIKRRHHCRACGKVLCSVCCSEKYKLEFLTEPESRICVRCYLILTQREETYIDKTKLKNPKTSDTTENMNAISDINSSSRSPNPNNPMEYCSTIPPHRQVSLEPKALPSVIVPVGVLKKDNGSYSSNSSNSSGQKARKRKSVRFIDGITPGSELASIDQWNEPKQPRRQNDRPNRNSTGNKPPTPVRTEQITDATTMGLVAQLFRGSIPPSTAAATVNTIQSSSSSNSLKGTVSKASSTVLTNHNNNGTKYQDTSRAKRLPPSGCDINGCFIPENETSLPPIVITKDESGCDFEYRDVTNNFDLVKRLQSETLKFAVQKNFFVLVKISNLNCCLNRTVINFTTYGMHHVGNDEIVILLEFEVPTSKDHTTNESLIPKDIFVHLNEIYNNAEAGNPIQDLSHTSPQQTNFLGSREYGGFIFIRPTFQCMQDVILPDNPFLLGILIHRYEVPWAKVFPLRLMLRLGAQYRYYPCPHISMVKRESVYAKIAQTIINFLADFRNYSYTLPFIRGMYIHMEDRQTTVVIPRNRLEDVIKAINNSSDHILAFGGNFSKSADGHLVCMQNVNDERSEMYAYSTQAINIQGQPRKITGASFFVLNESLKTTSGLSGKCSIVEDGLMVQILPSKMEEVRNSLKNQTDVTIVCGPIGADEQHTEIVCLKWIDNDKEFNIGVKSPIDDRLMDGISSMRVHASFNYSNANYSIRLTDIYVIKHDNWYNTNSSTISVATTSDITRMTEQIARSTSAALVSFLDLLAASKSTKIGLRATLHQDNVCYEAGTRGLKFPPLYMNALDNHLIPTLHTISSGIEEAIILELIFYILNV